MIELKGSGGLMGATLEKTGEKIRIELDGELTLPQADELKKTFLKALGEADDISIVLDRVLDVDLSLLQLFCSLHRSATQQKKHIKLEGNAPQAIKDAVDAAGFSRHAGCKLDLDKSCLWVDISGAHSG
jgi:ABC-type transporter Mla MlaB component